jgi:hypothetical protein
MPHNRKSCPTNRSSVLSGRGVSSNSRMSVTSQASGKGSNSRSSSNTFKGDRFIPFRGTTDNYFEEFIMNNDLYKNTKKQP